MNFVPVTALLAPSVLSADFARLGDEIRAVEAAGADWIHVDVMDGRFVPNLTIGPLVVAAVRRVTKLPLDVHLMIVEPERYVEAFAEAGADHITVHAEASTHLHRLVQQIHGCGKTAGVALNPATPPQAVDFVLGEVDLLLAMTVNPGFGGQSFLSSVLPKVETLRRRIRETGRPIRLEIDGGIKPDNVAAAARAGADLFVAGSAIFGQKDYAGAIRALRDALRTAA